MARIAVLGAGAWGTSIATVLCARLEVALWAQNAEQAQAIHATRRNERYLPGIEIPTALLVPSDLARAVHAARIALVARPVAGLRDVLQRLDRPMPVVWLCKGFEEGSGLLPHQVAAETLGDGVNCGALSGPSFAEEVARGLPCALTLASTAADFAREAAALLHGGRMRIYYSGDVMGVEIGGAVKNVIAIGAGIFHRLGLRYNARAALITRGLADMARLSAAMGGQPETVMGLTGAGDLILTATGDLSRNRRVGMELARGKPLAEILSRLGHVAEGARSAKEVSLLAKKKNVEMPVTDAVQAVLDGRLKPAAAVELLLSRDPKRER